MKRKATLTIGIPVYNEESNICNLLDTLTQQNSSNYILEKIIIVNDGSTDQTVKKIQKYIQRKKYIKLINDRKHLGKCARLNQIYEMNESDIIMTFDGDIVVGGKQAISTVIKKFLDKNIALASFNDMPTRAKTFAQKIANSHFMLWYEIRSMHNSGDNIYNVHGNAQALSNSFAKKVKYPKNITADQDFLYISLLLDKKKFVHVKNAKIYFQTAETISEHLFQTSRFLNEKNGIKEYFGAWVDFVYLIPLHIKFIGVVKRIFKDPLLTAFALLAIARLNFLPRYTDILNTKGMWSQIKSTKKAILESYELF